MKHGLNRPALEYGSGFPTLLSKEVKRFYKVAFQTIAAPVLTAVLYLMIFGHVLEGKEIYGCLSYTAFLIPGLVMMSVLQNAFAKHFLFFNSVQGYGKLSICFVGAVEPLRVLRRL